MLVGTIGSFVAIVLANNNSQTDQARANELYAVYQKESEEYQAKVDAQTRELSDKYYAAFNEYAARPAAFNAGDVTELKTNDLKVGDGAELTAESTFTAYYLGWNPSGKVFDGSIKDGALTKPIDAAPGGVIKGWTDGVAGMKVGGVRELSIPSDLAYGETARSEDIPANTPLKFIIMVIPAPETIPAPTPSAELIKFYEAGLIQ